MAKITKVEENHQFIKNRGWGVEIWIENISDYCGKLLLIEAGKKGSLHFHMKKLETMYLQSGEITIKLIDPETGKPYTIDLKPGESIKIPRGQVHQICGGSVMSELFEFSTKHEEEDSLRVEKGD